MRWAPSYGVAGSPVLPITRIGGAPGALTSGWSAAPATAQSVQLSIDQAR
jgi:hypothetical protein